MVKFWDFMHWIWESLYGIKDAIMGSLIYSVYAHIHLKTHIWKNVMSFFTGIVFSIYVAPQLSYFFPNLNYGLIAFISGILGMESIKFIIEFDYQGIVERLIDMRLGKTKEVVVPKEDIKKDIKKNIRNDKGSNSKG